MFKRGHLVFWVQLVSMCIRSSKFFLAYLQVGFSLFFLPPSGLSSEGSSWDCLRGLRDFLSVSVVFRFLEDAISILLQLGLDSWAHAIQDFRFSSPWQMVAYWVSIDSSLLFFRAEPETVFPRFSCFQGGFSYTASLGRPVCGLLQVSSSPWVWGFSWIPAETPFSPSPPGSGALAVVFVAVA